VVEIGSICGRPRGGSGLRIGVGSLSGSQFSRSQTYKISRKSKQLSRSPFAKRPPNSIQLRLIVVIHPIFTRPGHACLIIFANGSCVGRTLTHSLNSGNRSPTEASTVTSNEHIAMAPVSSSSSRAGVDVRESTRVLSFHRNLGILTSAFGELEKGIPP
jgi:hypothetical protein